ncbi:MAG: hypothetical protein IT452_02745 [Planctomycetia bacterium]|nr:hypothetical protein [Planctomycetia bacterium]
MHDRPEDMASRIGADLVRLAKEYAKRFAAGERAWVNVDGVELKVTIPFRGGDGHGVAQAILDQLHDALEEAYVARASYVRGRVHCFRCGTSGCGHAVPPGRKSVFAAYGRTGTPVWEEFAQVCLQRGDGSAARIYGEPPEIVAHYDAGSALRSEQLPDFGRDSKSYRVLGQVTAGYLPLWNEALGGPDKAALTYQAVESRWGSKGFKLDLNAIGPFPKAPKGERQEWLDFTLDRLARQTREQLERVQVESKDAPDLEPLVAPALRKLASSLEKLFRRERRRTGHGNERAREGDRPTGKALEDAAAAQAEEILRDARTGATVVLGPALRVHIFGRTGRHVTSAVYSKDAIERKQRARIWLPVPAAEAAALRRGIEEAASGDEEAG